MLFNASAALSALLFIATCVLWVRGYQRVDNIRWFDAHCYMVTSGGGVVYLQRWTMVRRVGDVRKQSRPINFREVVSQSRPGSWKGYLSFPYSGYSSFRKAGASLSHPLWPQIARYGLQFSVDTHDAPRIAEDWILVKGVWIPYWLLAIATSVLPAAWIVKRQVRRPKTGYCGICGYDLRASQARCPECGTVQMTGIRPSSAA